MEIITREVIENWWTLGLGQQPKPTHMIVVSDTFDYEYYPVYFAAENTESVLQKVAAINKENFSAVKEVYNYALPFDTQVVVPRAFFTEMKVQN